MEQLRRIYGWVIRKIPYRESTDIVTVFSREMGKIKTIAKGRRRQKSTSAGPLELFNFSELVIYFRETRDLHTLKESYLAYTLENIREDYNRYQYTSRIALFVDKATPSETPLEKLFALTEKTVRMIDNPRDSNIRALFCGYLIKAVSFLGHRPLLKHCIECKEREGIKYFSTGGGGVLCEDCAERFADIRVLDSEEKKLLNRLLYSPLEEIGNLDMERLTDIIEEYVEVQLDVTRIFKG